MKTSFYTLVILALLGTSACSDSDNSTDSSAAANDTSADSGSGDDASDAPDDTDSNQVGPNPDYFLAAGLAENITTTSCTLTDGTTTQCYKVVINGAPANAEIGPFCPSNITDDATEGGIWFDGSGEVYPLEGQFFVDVKTLYGDDWELYDEDTGEIHVTDTQVACEAAARPNVAAEYQNHCVQCSISYYDGGMQQTILIPVTPVPMSNPETIGADLGVSLNGVVIAGPAPVTQILAANTIAAFDDCGGHVNPAEGYHYHASLGCSEVVTTIDDHANLMGYALDGYGIYGMLNADGEEDYDLDECRGHEDETRGYHYHAASAAENMFIGCYQGAQGSIALN
ncbi:YHYH protein [Alteromonas sp. 1_MG-2023]|uniref:YHYH protein n=1 Tax=Alteromonas sp. 1_MG-2023 TaxID=3062669 RepID=UPI0026E3BF06|nr:YHYH protein [Alteromonas sp. 1_MG-2023]MDO6567625.1 YHYH protein [Alteromonas sp. 1_MG-2023]